MYIVKGYEEDLDDDDSAASWTEDLSDQDSEMQ